MLTVVVEVVESRQIPYSAVGVAGVRQTCVGIPQLVEEGVHHGVDGGQSLRRCVLQQLRDQIDSVGVGFAENLGKCQVGGWLGLIKLTNLVERMRLDLRKLVFHVIGVHGADLVSRGCAKNLDDLDELVDTRLTGEQRLSQHELSHDTAGRPDIWIARVSRSLYAQGPHDVPIFVV